MIFIIQIILKSGQKLINDPKIGFNSNSIETIKQSLEEFGSYQYFYTGGNIHIPKKEIVEIKEI